MARMKVSLCSWSALLRLYLWRVDTADSGMCVTSLCAQAASVVVIVRKLSKHRDELAKQIKSAKRN